MEYVELSSKEFHKKFKLTDDNLVGEVILKTYEVEKNVFVTTRHGEMTKGLSINDSLAALTSVYHTITTGTIPALQKVIKKLTEERNKDN